MLIIPAIDLKDGHCVRLKQGNMASATVFSDDPAAMAKHWASQGARRLHLVDLNGAFAGKPKNEEAIKAIVAALGDAVPVQLGGGIRDLDTVERYLDDGISYIIIGSAAVKTPGFLHDACYAFPGHIMVGLDARDGRVAVDGWSKVTGHDVSGLRRGSHYLHRYRSRRNAERRERGSDLAARQSPIGTGRGQRRHQ
jgi:phosphoribosylformimino-5-aminoimidazole carboxamide ribotide isomerase